MPENDKVSFEEVEEWGNKFRDAVASKPHLVAVRGLQEVVSPRKFHPGSFIHQEVSPR